MQNSQGRPHREYSPPPGLKLALDFLTHDEEQQLIALVEASGLSYHDYDPDNPRCSASFGWVHDFQTDRFSPGKPLPEGFHAVRDRAAAFAGEEPDHLAECFLNRYEPGSIIQWHFDKPAWKTVAGISLGVPATMQFRKAIGDDFEYTEVRLPPLSIYVLSGEARHSFQHSMPPTVGTRWSITFRSFSGNGPGRNAPA